MNKEELKQEAEKYTNKLLEDWELYDPEALQEAYIAGAKAHLPQWHDLRKDPNNLPIDGRNVSDQNGNNVRYVKHLNKWFYRHRSCEANVIAWCELPKFEE